MNDIKSALIAGLTSANIKSCNIIINSQYMTYRGKNVYCEVDRSDGSAKLQFYITPSKTNAFASAKVYYDHGYWDLQDMISSTELFGVSLPIMVHKNNFLFKMVPSMNLAIIETEIYMVAKAIAQQQLADQQSGRLFNWNSISVETTRDITLPEYGSFMNNFWSKSRKAYKDLVYPSKSSRFIKQLYKSNEFYKILDTFIPVFVDCDLFFNPMHDSTVLNTKMFKTACAKNRLVTCNTSDYSLSCYFLTQEEICRAFNMTKFMRFSPAFWYDIFMGLLYPTEDSEFPSVNRKVMRGPQNVTDYGLPRVMSVNDYLQALKSIELSENFASADVSFGGVQTPVSEIKPIINSYHEIDSLYMACETVRTSIAYSGASVLDEKNATSVDNLYSIMLEASL